MNPRLWLEKAQRLLPPARDGALVLAYHLVGAGTGAPVDLDVATFRAQLELLRERFEVVPLERVLFPGQGSRPIAAVTFDDAYANFRDVAWPIVSSLGLPVTLYVPTAFVDGRSEPPIRGAGLRACRWDDLKELARSGVDMGSHSVTHPNLTRISKESVDRELRESRETLEDKLGRAVTSFCYPRAKWSPAVATQVAAHYRTGVVAGGRRVRPGTHPARIPRFPIRRDLGSFSALIESRVWLAESSADWVRRWLP